MLRDRTLPAYPSLRTDIRDAGAASWVNENVVSDSEGGYTLITSPTPKDLDAFLDAINKALSGS